MATAASGNAGVGTIKVVVGDVKVIGIDGVARQAMVGDKVFAKETIQTNANAIVQVQLENGRTLDLGRDSKIALDDDVLNVGQTPTTAPATTDIAALQAQIAAGADPSKVAEATAAGGAPGAGGTADGSGGTPVTIDQANSTGLVTSGFATAPAGIAFPDLPPALLPTNQPTISIAVAVNVAVGVLPAPGVVPVAIEGSPGTLGVGGAQVQEGTAATNKLVNFVITLDHPFDGPVTVSYILVNGDGNPAHGVAVNGVDYIGSGATITIPAGATSFVVPVQIVQDSVDEGPNTFEAGESFRIVLTGATGATIEPGAASAVITIVDDDTTVRVSINDVTTMEPHFVPSQGDGPVLNQEETFSPLSLTVPGPGEGGNSLINGLGGPAGFGENTMFRNDDSSTGLIDVTSIFGPGGMNFFGTNYTGFYINNNGNITFDSPLSTFTPFGITADNGGNPMIAAFFADFDTRPSSSHVSPGGTSTGTNAVYWDLDTANGVITITWDDVGYYNQQTNLVNAVQLRIFATGGGNFGFEFRYENVEWTTGGASGGSGGLGGEVAHAGWTTGDGVNFFELPQSGNQTAILSLETTSNADTPQDGNWVFNVVGGQVTEGPPTVLEGNIATFTVSLDAVSASDVVVAFTTADGTAISGGSGVAQHDYGSTSGTVTIPAGQLTATIQVTILGDGVFENSEQYNVILTGIVSGPAVIADNQGIGTILDGDAPSISISDGAPSAVFEGGEGTVTFTVTLTVPADHPVTVNYTTVDGTAVAGSDFTAQSGTITFAPGQTTAQITVPVLDDSVFENPEAFTVQLSNASPGVTITDNSGQGNIYDNDAAPSFSINDVTRNEADGTITFTVTKTGATAVGSTVDYSVAPDSAVTPGDYTAGTSALTGTLSFAAGVTTQTITLNITNDTIAELTESFKVNLSNPVNATISDNQGIGTITDNDPVLVVGSNSGDSGNSTPDHLIPNPTLSPDVDGNIVGGGGNDVLIGDPGGFTTGSYNLTFMIDVSGSVDNTELAQMKSAINTLLDKFVGVSSLHVDIGYFSASATILPTSYTTVAAAKAAINGIDGSGNTNYQAALTAINTMVGDDPAADHRLVYFLTDGDPTAGSWQTTPTILTGMNGLSNISDAATAINGIQLNAIGIGLGDTSGSDTSATRLNAIDNTTDGYLPIASFATLDLGSLLVPVAVGADSITGGDGNDIIFGDAPNTDALAGNGGGFGAAGTHNGAGFDVLHHYTPVSAGTATDAQVQTWLSTPANAQGLNVAGDPRGANDTLDGGAGNDTIFGQGGNDRIIGGAGNDIIYGGTGNDSMTGGTGSDTFRFSEALTAGNADRITDFTVGTSAADPEKDILNLHDVLPVAAQGQTTLGALSAYISVDTASSPGNTLIKVDADGAGGGAAVTVVTLEGVTSLTLAQLLTNNQIVT